MPHVSARARVAATTGALPLVAALVLAVLPGGTHAEGSGSASLYVFQDSNATTVISPRLTLRAPVLEDSHLNLSYAVDAWTSASVDIIASASQSVTEQRDELTAGIDHAFGDVTVNAGYRFSSEPDYKAHGGSLGVTVDLAQNATTLGVNLGGGADQVGRAGDLDFAETVNTLNGGASLTQVLDADTLVQALYDLTLVRGYQASPYRFIAIGGTGLCAGAAPLCLPEQNPRERIRQAGMLRVRRALTEQWSIGGGYRIYFDDWGILSHTASADLAWAPELRSVVAVTYRFYTQNGADHYKPRYQVSDLQDPYFTRDKELSPLTSHRVGLEVSWLWEVSSDGTAIVTGLEAAPTFFSYHDFPLIDRITSFEVTGMLGMEYD